MDYNSRGSPLTFFTAIFRAVNEDSRYKKKVTQTEYDHFVEGFIKYYYWIQDIKNHYEFDHKVFRKELVDSLDRKFCQDLLSCDIIPCHGDPPGLRQVEIAKSKPWPTVFLTAAVYSGKTKEAIDQYIHQVGPEQYATYFEDYNTSIAPVTPARDFTCLMSRMDPMRQSWLYLLIRRQIFEKGFVSFLMDTSRIGEFQNLPPAQAFEEQYKKYLSNFAPEHELAKEIVPYRNFPADQDLDSVIMQSKFNIVLETFFSDNDEMTFTEKIFRSVRLPRPWLLFSVKHAVKQLREWGLDTLDDLVDHSYDNIDNEILRQSAILDIAQKMLDFDVEANQERLHQASKHNLALLKKWQENLDSTALRDCKALLDKIYNLYGTDK
jgi:hypothetical protein